MSPQPDKNLLDKHDNERNRQHIAENGCKHGNGQTQPGQNPVRQAKPKLYNRECRDQKCHDELAESC